MKIQPMKIEGLSCMNSCVVTALSELRMPYWYLFAWTFDLKYYEANPENYRLIGHPIESGKYLIGNRIASGENDTGKNHYLILAEQYFGMRDTVLSDKSIETVEKLLNQNRFFAFQTNVYWCSWMPNYKKEDLVHTVLVNRIMPDRTIECVDSMQSTNYVYMSYEDFNQGVDCIHLLEFHPCQLTPEQIFIDSIEHTKNSNMFAHFEHFIHDIECCTDYEEEFQFCDKGFWFCQLYRNTVYYLGGTRKMYSFLLQKLSQDTNNKMLMELSEHFIRLGVEWDKLKSPLMRYYYTKQFDKSQKIVVQKLKEIKENEYKLFSQMLEYQR